MAIEAALAQTWTATPGIVVSVDLAAQTLTVQPAIQGETMLPNGKAQRVNMPLLVDVPIVWPRAGGFAMTFPIAAGDEVLVVFGSRAIDSWWQSGGIGPQAEARMHDLSDGFAILAPTSQAKKLDAVSTDNLQIRNEDGSVYIEMTPDGDININEPGNININCTSKVTLVCPQTDITGNVKVTGDVLVTGTVTGQTDVVFGPQAVRAIDHKHAYTTPHATKAMQSGKTFEYA